MTLESNDGMITDMASVAPILSEPSDSSSYFRDGFGLTKAGCRDTPRNVFK
jgi:hypothetical protein